MTTRITAVTTSGRSLQTVEKEKKHIRKAGTFSPSWGSLKEKTRAWVQLEGRDLHGIMQTFPGSKSCLARLPYQQQHNCIATHVCPSLTLTACLGKPPLLFAVCSINFVKQELSLYAKLRATQAGISQHMLFTTWVSGAVPLGFRGTRVPLSAPISSHKDNMQ